MILTAQEILAELHKLSPTSFALDRYNVLCKAQSLKMWTELKGYKCNDCSTPNFTHLIIPLRVFNQIEEELKPWQIRK